jgi:hypothetical protein
MLHVKKTDMEKLMAKKIVGAAGHSKVPDRFGKDSAVPLDKREQRERDRELGLVPFAVKLHEDLVKQLQDLAKKKGTGLNEVTAELLQKGLKAK